MFQNWDLRGRRELVIREVPSVFGGNCEPMFILMKSIKSGTSRVLLMKLNLVLKDYLCNGSVTCLTVNLFAIVGVICKHFL
jgi:hypothetical protein